MGIGYFKEKEVQAIHLGEYIKVTLAFILTIPEIPQTYAYPTGAVCIPVDNGDGTWGLYISDATTRIVMGSLTRAKITKAVCVATVNLNSLYKSFTNCNKMKVLDLSAFVLSVDTDMEQMCYYSQGIDAIKMPANMMTINPTGSMKRVFYNCSKLRCIDHLDTRAISDTSDMFYNTLALINPTAADQTALEAGAAWTNPDPCPIPPFVFCTVTTTSHPTIDKVTGYQATVDVVNNGNGTWNIITSPSVTQFSFRDYAKADFTHVVCKILGDKINDLSKMFYGCTKLESISFESTWDSSNVRKMEQLFNNCPKLTNLDLTNFDTSSALNMFNMFSGCALVPELDVSSFDTSLVGNMSYMFYNCKKVKFLDIKDWDISATTNIANMFYSCEKLMCLPNIDTTHNPTTTGMFSRTYDLFAPDAADQTAIMAGADWNNPEPCPITNPVFQLIVTSPSQPLFNTYGAGSNEDIDYIDNGDGTWGVNSFYPLSDLSIADGVAATLITKVEFVRTDSLLQPVDFRGGYSGGAINIAEIVFSPDVSFAKMTSLSNAFYRLNKLKTIVGLEHVLGSNITSTSSMFKQCFLLTDASGIETLDVSQVTDMGNMFDECENLTSLDLSGWDVSAVKYMDNLFYKCAKLESLNLSGWNTPELTKVGYMFYGCSKLAAIDVSGFNTSKINDFNNMFYGCESLESLDLSSFDTSIAVYLHNLFVDCYQLQTVDLSSFDTANAQYLSAMFRGCFSLVSVDLSSFVMANNPNISRMFEDCHNLKCLTNIDTTLATNTTDMFLNCVSLVAPNAAEQTAILAGADWTNTGSCPPPAVPVPFKMVVTSPILPTVTAEGGALTITDNGNGTWNVEGEELTKILFTPGAGIAQVTRVELVYLNSLTDMTDFFRPEWSGAFPALTEIEFTLTANLMKVTSISGMFSQLTELTSIIGLGHLRFPKAKSLQDMFANCTKLTPPEGLNSWKVSNIENMEKVFYSCSAFTSLNISNWDTSNVTNMKSMFGSLQSIVTLDLSSLNTAKVTDMEAMFHHCFALFSVDMSSFDTANVVNMEAMFNGCFVLEAPVVSNFNTAKVTNMSRMFERCYGLEILDISSWDTASLTNMYAMFDRCKVIEHIDLSSFVIRANTEMHTLFAECLKLKSVVMPSNIMTIQPTVTMLRMFEDCGDLFCINQIDSTFTSGTSKMFDGCTSLTFPDAADQTAILAGAAWVNPNPCPPPEYTAFRMTITSSSDPQVSVVGGAVSVTYNGDGTWSVESSDRITSCTVVNQQVTGIVCHEATHLTSMEEMFFNLRKVTSIVFEAGWNTAKVKSMHKTFRDCRLLVSLDISHFDTSRVTDMKEMFKMCEVLSSIDISHFNTPRLTTVDGLFDTCKKLTSVNINGLDTSKVTTFAMMFHKCEILTTVDLTGLNTSEVATFAYMFARSYKLTTLDLSSFNVSKAFSFQDMFMDCFELVTADVSGFTNTTALATTSSMFENCAKILTIDLSNLDTSKVVNINGMFLGCTSLVSVDMSNFNSSLALYVSNIFKGCENLTSLNLDAFDLTDKLVSCANLFYGCKKLTCLTQLALKPGATTTDMFYDCPALVAPNASEQTDIEAGTPWTNPNPCP